MNISAEIGPVLVVALGTVFIVPVVSHSYWAWNAPSRELQHRTPEGAALTRDEARKLVLAKLSYAHLTMWMALCVTPLLTHWGETDRLHGWGIIWLMIAAVGIVACGGRMIQKWYYGRQQPTDQD